MDGEGALTAEDTIDGLKIRDQVGNLDVEKQMTRALNDELYDVLLEPGTPFRIMSGPLCGDDGLRWRKIETPDGAPMASPR